jgi:Tfp pilus assembly protein FimT
MAPVTRGREAGFSAVELLVTLVLVGTLAAVSVPMTGTMLQDFRISGDAHGVSNAIAMTKMRAAAQYSRARLYLDLTDRTYRMEIWRKTGVPGWVTEGGSTSLATAHLFTTGPAVVPPPNTQAVLAQAPPCLDDAGAVIANTACVIFNSRGLPVDGVGAPATVRVAYVSGPTAVFGVVIGATGQMQVWRMPPASTGAWRQQ